MEAPNLTPSYTISESSPNPAYVAPVQKIFGFLKVEHFTSDGQVTCQGLISI